MTRYSYRTSLQCLFIAACCIVLQPSSASAATPDTQSSKPAKKAKHKSVRKVQQEVPGPSYAKRTDAMQWADEIAARRELDPHWVRATIGKAHFTQSVAQAVLPPVTGVQKNWNAYRKLFVEPIRIRAGVRFWQQNSATLAKAEQETGVPASIIIGVLGVETMYGQHMGKYKALDALATLAFDFPAGHPKAAERTTLFRNELEEFLVLTRHINAHPENIMGSYAGALGLPQFMPSSWNRYAIDFSGDGKVDLFANTADAIGSVANYFRAFNWKRGLPIRYTVQVDPANPSLPTLLAPDILPTLDAATLKAKGLQLSEQTAAHQGPLALVELQNGDDPPVYVLGSENFYCITRYNWSSYYAMAVIDLGEAVANAMQK